MIKLTSDQIESIKERLSDPKEVAKLGEAAKKRFDEANGIDPDSPTEYEDFSFLRTHK